jgi:hypothetical protein
MGKFLMLLDPSRSKIFLLLFKVECTEAQEEQVILEMNS